MSRPKAALALIPLAALALGAFGAQEAGATVAGTTMFTCEQVAPLSGTFLRPHCRPGIDQGPGEYEHVEVAENTTTFIKFTNNKTGTETETTKFKATVAGTAFELQATAALGEGEGVDLKAEPGEAPSEHYVHIKNVKISFTGATVTKPAGNGCKIFFDEGGKSGTEGKFETEKLTLTSRGQGHSLTVKPETGNVLASFIISNCAKTELNGTYTLTGEIRVVPDGATLTFASSTVTTEGTPFLNSSIEAGAGGSFTLSGRDNLAESFTPIGFTTVVT